MEAPLKDRVNRWVRAALGPAPDRTVMARSLAFLFLAGATIALFALALLPLPEQTDVAGTAAAIAAGYVLGVLLLVLSDRVPLWALQVLLACGTGIVTAGIYFSGPGSHDNEMFYLWATVYAFYFFDWRRAVPQLLLAAVAYAGVLVALDGSPTRWVISVGTLVVAGVFVKGLRRRVDGLIARLADTTRTDPLTGLLNRRGFVAALGVELERARRSRVPLSLLVGDIDHFTQLNERWGQRIGDSLLEGLTGVLVDATRLGDTLAKTGGGEFAVILPETDEHDAYLISERLRADVQEIAHDQSLPTTMSFGVVSYPNHGETVEALVNTGSRALSAAKQLGRNRSVIHSAEVARILNADRHPTEQGREHLATVLALAEALDIRDLGTAKHSQTVGHYAEQMARELRLSKATVERVRLAGILHDVGKIGVSDSILRKPGPLTEEEWVEMRKHPETGARLLGSGTLDDIRRWILTHHERPDGRGYPRRLAADGIPLEARILAVADAYEAMTADRCYRPAMGHEAARQELQSCAGAQFDKVVVHAFLRVLRRDEREPAVIHSSA